jgi:hypothetical protein
MSNAFHSAGSTLPHLWPTCSSSGSPPLITARYFSSNSSDSGSLRTPCPPPACAAGRHGITPAFGYSAPHPSAGGTLTLLTHALLSTHYGGVRLLESVHHRRRLLTFPMRAATVIPSRSDPRPPRFRCVPSAHDVAFDPAGRQHLAWRCRTCCFRANKNSQPLRYLIFRGSIPHPVQSLCTLRSHRRR